MEDVITRLENEFKRVSFGLSLILADLDEIKNEYKVYQDWMLEKKYEDKNIGYFNCLPDEVMIYLVSFLPKSRIPEVCKSFKYLLHHMIRESVKLKLGKSFIFLEENFHYDYKSWKEILDGKNTSYKMCKDCVLHNEQSYRSSMHKVIPYTDGYWSCYSNNIYMNSSGVIIRNIRSECSSDSHQLFFNNMMLTYDDCCFIMLKNKYIAHIPKRVDTLVFKEFAALFKQGIVYKEYKDEILSTLNNKLPSGWGYDDYCLLIE
jgi:hypothetical protein